jgi:hypothetical protein
MPSALVQAIRESVFAFSQSDQPIDDLTSVAIRIEETELPAARAGIDIVSDLKQLRRVREFVRTFCSSLPGLPLDEDSTNPGEV